MFFKPDCGEDSCAGSGKLVGRAALVTGGDSGIGRAVAVAFAREGADVAAAYLEEGGDAREVAALVRGAGRKCVLIRGDLSDEAACAACVDAAAAGLGGSLTDVVLNHALQPKAAETDWTSIPAADIQRALAVNAGSFLRLAQLAAPRLAAARGPSITITTSIQAYQP